MTDSIAFRRLLRVVRALPADQRVETAKLICREFAWEVNFFLEQVAAGAEPKPPKFGGLQS